MVAAGSAEESSQHAGLSQFTSRFLLRGTETRSARRVMEQVAKTGALLDWRSDDDTAGLRLVATSTTWETSLPAFLDALLSPAFEHAEFHRLWADMDWELEARTDDAYLMALEGLRSALYADGGYGNPWAGTTTSLDAIELSHVKQFYARYFVPENMVLVAVGNFDPGVMYERLNIRLGALPSATGAAPGGAPSRRASSLPVGIPASKTLRQVRAGALAWIMIGFPAPGGFLDDHVVMLVLSTLIGGGSSNRLYSEIRDQQGLAYTVGSFYAQHVGDSYLATYAGVRPQDVDDTVAGMRAIVAEVARGGVTLQELEAAKMDLLGGSARSREWSSYTAYQLGWFELSGIGYARYDELPERIRAVTLDDVQRVAAKYLQEHIVSIVTPATGDG